MENATDALKMTFAVFMFIVALSLFFSLLTKAKDTADSVLWYSDKANYYDWTQETTDDGRTVGEDAVIATLSTQAKEKVFVQIDDGTNVVTFTLFNTNNERTEYIERYLKTGTNKYKERVVEISTGGVYRTAEDGTKIVIQPGTTRTYVIYKKI